MLSPSVLKVLVKTNIKISLVSLTIPVLHTWTNDERYYVLSTDGYDVAYRERVLVDEPKGGNGVKGCGRVIMVVKDVIEEEKNLLPDPCSLCNQHVNSRPQKNLNAS